MNELHPVGLDIGYGYTKAANATKAVLFPSLVGSAEKSQFGISNGHSDFFIEVDGREYAIGETAITFSRFVSRLESRNWIESPEWLALAQAALTLCETDSPARIVVGLPLSYFNDKETVKRRLKRMHTIDATNGTGRSRHLINIQDVVVVPQPFGSLFRTVFLPNGNIREDHLPMLEKRVGIIDFGSNNTNLLEVDGGREVESGSTAINMGGWDLCRAAREHLLQEAPGAEFRDHKLAAAIEQGYYEYFGRRVPLTDAVKPILRNLIDQVSATATQLWQDGADLWAILVTGGLANVVGDDIRQFFRRHERVIVVQDPQMANARGFYAYGKFLNQAG